ncbi:MAG: IS982 family transposase [Cyclobacteriaceae bacterium]
MLSDELNHFGNVPRPGPAPSFSDVEVIALTLTAEYLSIDSENQLFKKIHADYAAAFPTLHSRPQFNRRKRALFPLLERLRQKLVAPFLENEDIFMTDSKPLPICEYARSAQSTVCQETDYARPNYGYCASKQERYYGYKLHSVQTLEGVIVYPDLAPARAHDSKFLSDLQGQLFNCLLITDKGYVSEDWQQTFRTQNNVLLYTPKRKNQTCPVHFVALFDRVRRQIERTYSQLKDQFFIERNYAKTFWGYKTRILSKIAALTMIQYLNKFELKRPINYIKHAIY